MTKPTPNPWYVEQDNDGRDLYIVAKAKDDIGQRIATIEISGFGSAKAGDWANARLIAAAPERRSRKRKESGRESHQVSKVQPPAPR